MLTFLEKNSKDRSKARLGAITSGAKTSAVAAAEAMQDSIPASGPMSQHELNEVSDNWKRVLLSNPQLFEGWIMLSTG